MISESWPWSKSLTSFHEFHRRLPHLVNSKENLGNKSNLRYMYWKLKKKSLKIVPSGEGMVEGSRKITWLQARKVTEAVGLEQGCQMYLSLFQASTTNFLYFPHFLALWSVHIKFGKLGILHQKVWQWEGPESEY